MRLIKYLNEQSHPYKNWIFPNEETMRADFNEYKKKEERKWKRRSEIIGSRFPIFEDYDHFKSSLKNAKVITLTPEIDKKILNRSYEKSIEGLKSLVGTYTIPRDVDRIVKGFQKGDKIPYPIVIKGDRKMWIMAGNTRLNTSFIMGVEPKVLMVDVSE